MGGDALEGGWNVLVGADNEKIDAAVKRSRSGVLIQACPFGEWYAAERIGAVVKIC